MPSSGIDTGVNWYCIVNAFVQTLSWSVYFVFPPSVLPVHAGAFHLVEVQFPQLSICCNNTIAVMNKLTIMLRWSVIVGQRTNNNIKISSYTHCRLTECCNESDATILIAQVAIILFVLQFTVKHKINLHKPSLPMQVSVNSSNKYVSPTIKPKEYANFLNINTFLQWNEDTYKMREMYE